MDDTNYKLRKSLNDTLISSQNIFNELKNLHNKNYNTLNDLKNDKIDLLNKIDLKSTSEDIAKKFEEYKNALDAKLSKKKDVNYKQAAEKTLELFNSLKDIFFDSDNDVLIPDDIQKSSNVMAQLTFFKGMADTMYKIAGSKPDQTLYLNSTAIKMDSIEKCKSSLKVRPPKEYIEELVNFTKAATFFANFLKENIDDYKSIIKNLYIAEYDLKNIKIDAILTKFLTLFIDVIKNTSIRLKGVECDKNIVDKIKKEFESSHKNIRNEFIENGPIYMLSNDNSSLSKIAIKYDIYPLYVGNRNSEYGKSIFEQLNVITKNYNEIRTNLYNLTGEILSKKNKIKELDAKLNPFTSGRTAWKEVRNKELNDIENQKINELRDIFGDFLTEDQLKTMAKKEMGTRIVTYQRAKNKFNDKMLNFKYLLAHGKRELASNATKKVASGLWSFAKNVFEGKGYDLNEIGKSLIKSSIKNIAKGVGWSIKNTAYMTGLMKSPEMKAQINSWKSSLEEEYRDQQKKQKLLKKYNKQLEEMTRKSSSDDVNKLFENTERIFQEAQQLNDNPSSQKTIENKLKNNKDKKEAIQALSGPVPSMEGVSSDNENMEIIAAGVEAAMGLATTSFDIAANTYAEKDMSTADSAINNEIRLNSRNITRIASNIKDMVKNIKNKGSTGILSIFGKKPEAVKSKEIEFDKKTSWWDKIKGILGGLALLMGIPFSFLKKALGAVFDISKLLLKGGFVFGKWLIKTIFSSGLVKFIGEEIVKALKSTTLGKWIFSAIDGVKNSIEWVKEQFFKLRDSVKSIGKFIKDLSTPLFKILPKAAVEMLKGGLTKITDSVSGLFSLDEVKNSKVIKFEGPQQPISIYQRFKNTMSKVAGVIGNFFTNIYNNVASFISKLATTAWAQIKNIFPDFAKNAESFLSSLKNNLNEVVKTIKNAPEKIHEFLANTVEFAKKNINEISNTVKGWVDNIATIVSKPGKALAWAKRAIKIVIKVLFNVGKLLVKGALKAAAKAIPGVGLVASCAFAYDYWEKGEHVKAILTVVSGIAYCIPVFGTAVGMALDAGIIGYEIGELIANDLDELKKNPQNENAMANVVNTIGNANNETHRTLFSQEFQTNVINSIKAEPGSSSWGDKDDNNWEFDLSSLIENNTSSAFEINTATEDFLNAGSNDSNIFNINLTKQDTNNQPNRDFYNNQIEINKEEVEKIKETNGNMIDQVKDGMQNYFESVKHYKYGWGAKGVNGVAEMDCSAFVFNSLQAATNNIKNGDKIRNLLGLEDKDRSSNYSTSLFNKLAKTGASTFKTTFGELSANDLKDGDVLYEYVPGTNNRHIVYVRDGLVYESSSDKINGKSGVKSRPIEQFLARAKNGKRRGRTVLKVNSYQALTLAAEAAENGEGLNGPKITATSDVSLLGSNFNFSNKFDTSDDILPNVSELLTKFNPTKIKKLIETAVTTARTGFENAKSLITDSIKRLNIGDLHNNFDQLTNNSAKIASNSKLKREMSLKQAAANATTISSNLYQQMVYFKKYRFILNSKIDDVVIGKLKAGK